jgi:hypothetical protein
VFRTVERAGRQAVVWTDELPEWAAVPTAGVVDAYWPWRGVVPNPATRQAAAWGFHVVHGGKASAGVLGGRFEAHRYPHLRVAVAATQGMGGTIAPRFHGCRVGLPHEYVGGVLAGALQEPDRLGPGVLRIDVAAVSAVDSSWDAFRLLAIGLVRLFDVSGGTALPPELLPYFGGTNPEPPGSA